MCTCFAFADATNIHIYSNIVYVYSIYIIIYSQMLPNRTDAVTSPLILSLSIFSMLNGPTYWFVLFASHLKRYQHKQLVCVFFSVASTTHTQIENGKLDGLSISSTNWMFQFSSTLLLLFSLLFVPSRYQNEHAFVSANV